jgi:hypothetical protein
LDGSLLAGLAWCGLGVIAALAGNFHIASAFLIIASITTALALNIFERAQKPTQLQGVHSTFPVFIRLCYIWLAIAAILSAWASTADRNGGIWGASRHALTVGFLAGMIFAIGPRILPAFYAGDSYSAPGSCSGRARCSTSAVYSESRQKFPPMKDSLRKPGAYFLTLLSSS